MTFLYANRLKLCMRIDFNVGDSVIDVNIFKPHSTRSASASKAKRSDVLLTRLDGSQLDESQTGVSC